MEVVVELCAVVVAVEEETPKILTVKAPGGDARDALPSGSLDPEGDWTLDAAMRRWLVERTGIEVGYLEQLYTFGDLDRSKRQGERLLSLAYLALTRVARPVDGSSAWRDWYEYFPWEDWRSGRPWILGAVVAPALSSWVDRAEARQATQRRERVEIAFGLGQAPWNANRCLDRYELLYEAGLVEEARNRRGSDGPELGRPMAWDHRRIAATALERIRGKLSYRPVVFELLPETFTLLRLQRVVEALAGMRLHKPNFRRLVEQAQLVERTGGLEPRARGRPAELFRFRREVLRERPTPGVGLPRALPRPGPTEDGQVRAR